MAVNTYIAVEGQSLYDICLNTYGSLDYLLKMIIDSGISDINQVPHSGQIFYYDPQLVVDQSVNRQLTLGNIRYSTAFSKLGSVLYTIKEGTIRKPPINNYNPPPDPNVMTYSYEQSLSTDYTAGADGEKTINLPDLIGTTFIQIEKEIMPLKNNQWSWNKTSGTLTLSDDSKMSKDETLFILYKKIVTVTI